MKAVSLCVGSLWNPKCPVVEISDDEVKIGEEGNLCTLKKSEWNTLVEKVKSGELK